MHSLTIDMSGRYLTSLKRGWRDRHEQYKNINFSDKNCLTRYNSNALWGETGPDVQNILDHTYVLISDAYVFAKSNTFTF